MREIELLAPARNLECGIAAIDHGADAVYIGARNFGARHAAGNSVDDIRELCQYAHRFGVRVYATVNTIVYDHELDDAVQLVAELAEAGVDAVLVQDMGLLAEARRKGIKTEWHASTQTDNRTAEKVRWLRGLGFSRVVLARELTAGEIAEIHRMVPDVELEVFAHGALCVSFSGQCYASQYCFNRSANRGECAQMCRMKYRLLDADGNEVAPPAYYLSLKDQCQIDNLEKIIEAGACSLKIEGRLKDIAYVKNVVAAYSRRLDEIVKRSHGIYRRASWGKNELSFTPDLKKTFCRGYTDYFLNGRHAGIVSMRTPKAIGEYVGKVKEVRHGRQMSFNVASLCPFANGDGLCYIDSEGNVKGFRVNRAEGNRLFPQQMPPDLKPGTPLYRSQDHAFDKLLAGKTSVRRIDIRMNLYLDGTALRLDINGIDAPLKGSATLVLDEIQQAQKPQMENICRQLTKLGGTAYRCDEVSVAPELIGVFIPSSLLSVLRRQATENISITGRKKSVCENGDRHTLTSDSYHRRYEYLYNVANKKARQFYAGLGMDIEGKAFELGNEGEMVMQCRHCIRYALGCCAKNGGRRPEWKEPLSLRLDDGRNFTLEFDCKNCQMNVLKK
ncbi:MAG: U32 family peptidase [Bacteroidales bacterium]|nr:U32 family peptidase [Bacteroidales bacterium]MCM1147774.1 U32 family peptidase [Bacteroidales bacterium]MCM1206616.1 U32 family peptidase [Bacillota bacterium]MCM1510643.1 U32 family peptidase [Clostridium sp.]